jgi:hypothetical protein
MRFAMGGRALHSMARAFIPGLVKTIPPGPFPKACPSASADASRAAEKKRLLAMTVEERIREALSLPKRFRQLIHARAKSANGTGT